MIRIECFNTFDLCWTRFPHALTGTPSAWQNKMTACHLANNTQGFLMARAVESTDRDSLIIFPTRSSLGGLGMTPLGLQYLPLTCSVLMP